MATTIGAIPPAYDFSGHRKRTVSLDVTTTTKVLIHKFDAGYQFGLSEVEFYAECGNSIYIACTDSQVDTPIRNIA